MSISPGVNRRRFVQDANQAQLLERMEDGKSIFNELGHLPPTIASHEDAPPPGFVSVPGASRLTPY